MDRDGDLFILMSLVIAYTQCSSPGKGSPGHQTAPTGRPNLAASVPRSPAKDTGTLSSPSVMGTSGLQVSDLPDVSVTVGNWTASFYFKC